MINLYDYQKNIIEQIKKNIREHSNICVVSPCGSGKSIIQGKLTAMANKKGNRVLFLVHRKELCEQIEKTFKLCGVNFDLCKVGMVQTITRNLKSEPEPRIIITDENHHCLAKSYKRIYDNFSNAVKLGFTATPIRLGGKGLHPIYDKLLIGPSVKWLINNNRLSPYKLYSIKLVDTSKLHIRQGDFKNDEVNDLMEKSMIYGNTIKNYKKFAMGKKTIVYCSSVKASKATNEEFINNGISSKHLDGNTSKKEREKAIEDFRNNKIDILCNVDLFGEGFDVPDCECVILLRPTKSLSLYIQQSMRSMRYKPGKQAIIIDHVGNCFEHGLPDHDFQWTLNDLEKKKKKKDEEEKIKQCPGCFLMIENHLKTCPHCGYIFVSERKELSTNENIELKEITQEDIIRALKKKPMKYYKKITKLSDLIDFQEAKEYKIGWLFHKIEERRHILKIKFEDLQRIQKKEGYKFMWCIHKAKDLNIDIPSKYNSLRRYLH